MSDLALKVCKLVSHFFLLLKKRQLLYCKQSIVLYCEECTLVTTNITILSIH